MWRRWGDYIYALLVLLVFGAEATALVVLSFSFFARLFGLLSYARLVELLILVVLLTCIALALVMMHVLAYCALSAYRERTRRARAQRWTDLFVAWLFDRSIELPEQLPREAVEALLELRETIRGEDGVAVSELIESRGIAVRLIKRVKSRRLAIRIQAIEALAKARVPSALPLAYTLLNDPKPVVRFMATRVIARTLAAFPSLDHRPFVEALRRVELPAGVIEESLLLLDDAAGPVIAELLSQDGVQVRLARAALEAAGRMIPARDMAVANGVVWWMSAPDSEVRASAMQCAARMRLHVPDMRDDIVKSTNDPQEFVRVQATRALIVLDEAQALPTLWKRLHDVSWWVRRAAAETLRAIGPRGLATLERAQEQHPDKFARHMAQHVLEEAQLGGAT